MNVSNADIKKNSEEYTRILYDPFSYKRGRVPNPYGISTASIAIDNVSTVTTDANGNALVRCSIQDFNLTSAISTVTNGSWDPNVDSDAITAFAGLWTPPPVIVGDTSYRLVALGLRLRYTGSELNRSGTFFGCHNFLSNTLNSTSGNCPSLSQMQDSKHFRLLPTDGGLTIIYVPYEPAYLEFTKSSGAAIDAKNYTLFCGIIGGQASTTCLMLESKVILEYIPKPSDDDTVEQMSCVGNPGLGFKFSSEMIVRSNN